MLMSILPAATMAETPPPEAALATEWDVLAEVNRVRSNHGLAALRMAEGVREVARERSRSMKRLNYFAHVAPGGTDAAALLNQSDIDWRYWGEVIGWTRNLAIGDGTRWMVDWWMESPPHRDLLLSDNFNYAGVGIAQDGDLILWTIVFVNQADHTAPVAGLVKKGRAARGSTFTSGERVQMATGANTLIRWWGRDQKLATRTSGLQSFALQHKMRGGRWDTVLAPTTKRQAIWDLRTGVHVFRVRARDRAGNTGAWRRPLWVVVP
jgi:hypothetical protein